MADSGKHSLPNLKICIENDEETDNEDISFSDKDDYSFIDEPYSHRVEFSIRLNNNEGPQKFETKKYGNKDGDFLTGIDITQKEEAEKREERARRFGLEDTSQQVDVAALYSSLGIREEDVPKDERGIRLEAVHIRGVKNMSTKDVFEYFQEFAPSSVEWIEDNSCNVVWADSISAARALTKLSISQESLVSAGLGQSLPDVSQKNLGKETQTKEDMDENSNTSIVSSAASRGDGNSFSLEVEGEATSSEPVEMNEQPADPKSDGELSSSEDEADTEQSGEKKDKSGGVGVTASTKSTAVIDSNPKDIQWPPGKWRLGKSCCHATHLFMRYATKADRKLPGAEKRSQYYMKYGNPNYGGMRGLISNSRKRKIRSVKNKDEPSSRGQNADGHRRKNSSGLDCSDASDLSGSDSCGEIEPASRVSPPPAKQRMMRMYADDIEEELKAKRSGKPSVAHRMGIGHYGGQVKDARELLSRSDGSHRHLTNADHYHQYHNVHDDDVEEEEDGNYSSTYSTKSDLRAKLERKRMQLSSSSSASLSSASGHYPRLKIEVLD